MAPLGGDHEDHNSLISIIIYRHMLILQNTVAVFFFRIVTSGAAVPSPLIGLIYRLIYRITYGRCFLSSWITMIDPPMTTTGRPRDQRMVVGWLESGTSVCVCVCVMLEGFLSVGLHVIEPVVSRGADLRSVWSTQNTWSRPLVTMIFSLVVFASIINEGYVNIGSERLHCVFNHNADACNFGVLVGVVGLLACSFFFLLDFKFSSISSVKDRVWTFLYFVSFCFLANQWSQTTADQLPLGQGADAARAGLSVRAVQKYLLGTDMTLFTSEHLDGPAPAQPLPSNSPGGGATTGGGGEGPAYQSPPFSEKSAVPTYQVPIY
ncbi:hypothetical protein NHX12_032202 [Muraenolepis orangiensis]|uniref:MARVEL domain-containing protein n=1 Tax=Muraenolepis orangiensis TaxID=630683 RepID=A0A9Q0E717_9TELE|nr:hypothetical protein NHX12_032202 [Muraenolepis orangiensis]